MKKKKLKRTIKRLIGTVENTQELLVGFEEIMTKALSPFDPNWPIVDTVILNKLRENTNLAGMVYRIVLEESVSFEEWDHMGADLMYLVAAIMNFSNRKDERFELGPRSWPLHHILSTNFGPDHSLWKFIDIIQPAEGAVLRDILSLAMTEEQVPSVEQIEGWTMLERAAAETWAGSVHLRANDHDIVLPPKPDFLP